MTIFFLPVGEFGGELDSVASHQIGIAETSQRVRVSMNRFLTTLELLLLQMFHKYIIHTVEADFGGKTLPICRPYRWATLSSKSFTVWFLLRPDKTSPVGTLHKLYQGLMMAYWRCTFQVEMYLFAFFFFEGLVCFWSTLSDSSVKKWVSWLWEGYWVAGCKRNCSMQLLMVNILRLALIIRAIAIHEWTTYRRTFVGMVRLYSSNSFMG